MGSRKRNSKKKAPESRWQSLLKKPWIFAGAAFGLDLAMLIAGMVLSAAKLPVEYTASGDSIVHSQPLAFFGVTAAVVVALLCVLIGLIIGGAFLKKRRAAQITGAAGLLIVSLAMVGSSAFMALGSPVRERYSVSYSDEELRLIIEETEPYFGGCTVAFYLTGTEDEGKAALLAVTDLNEFNVSDDYAFAGWYKDVDLTQPCAESDKSGLAYPKFVKISDLITFKGGSLRTDLTGKDDYSKTSLRFGYEMHAPEGSKIDFENWGWYYKSPFSADETLHKAENYWRIDNNGVIANFVLSPIYKSGYKLDYNTVFDVTAQLAYITADGTGVKVKDQSRSRSVDQVAKAIKNDSFASADDLAYANGILGSN